jgi:hypothetical protein
MSDRLVRKRAAARLRQQRCRARKREAVLDERREQDPVETPSVKKSNEDTRSPPPSQDPTSVTHYPCNPPARFSLPRSSERDYWSDNSSAAGPIQNCVSFDSQRSFEESKRAYERVHGSPMHRSSPSRLPVVSPPIPQVKYPFEAIRVHEKKDAVEPQVAEEEAAAAAMLFLKTGPNKKSEPTRKVAYRRDPSPLYPIHDMKAPRVAAKYRYCNPWDVRPPRHMERYEYPRTVTRPPVRIPAYHPIPPPAPPLYRYHYPTYDRHEYE